MGGWALDLAWVPFLCQNCHARRADRNLPELSIAEISLVAIISGVSAEIALLIEKVSVVEKVILPPRFPQVFNFLISLKKQSITNFDLIVKLDRPK